MNVLTEYAQTSIEVKKSRFLAEAFVITSQAEARSLLREQKAKFQDATHVVHAFICGLNAEVSGCSDDGEPSGTAGRPVLEVLKGRNCTNIMITVTRWFGGTLLGTGGLVKAYGDAAKAVLELCKTEEYIAKVQFEFDSPYSAYEQIKLILKQYSAENITEDFAENIHIAGVIPEANKEKLKKHIFDFSNGKITLI